MQELSRPRWRWLSTRGRARLPAVRGDHDVVDVVLHVVLEEVPAWACVHYYIHTTWQRRNTLHTTRLQAWLHCRTRNMYV